MFNFSISSLIFNLIDVLCVILPILLAVAFMTIIERKQLAAHQRRVGPVKWFGKSFLWEKLSNSGDTLKTIVPSYLRKEISGWSNYSCMVTSYSMTENEMGYRGSKSDIFNNLSVKEQRVDGSWLTSNNKKVSLRCTLMGGESRYQVKILSNQINKIIYRSYSSNSYLPSSYTFAISPLNPYFVTGFSDAEASFIILILKEPRNTSNWTVKTRFSIGLHKKDTEILELIKSYFGGVGTILKQNENSVQYRVGSLKDLNEKIIPHFDNYTLITKKKADFIIFKKIINLMNNKEHLTLEGLQKIVAMKGYLNLGLSDEIKTNFSNISTIERPLVEDQKIIDPNWLPGFSSGVFMLDLKNQVDLN